MRIDGVWFVCEDAGVRPVIRAVALAADRAWQPINFLIDTGADNTIFTAADREALRLIPRRTNQRLAGIGGAAQAEVIEVELRLRQSDSIPVTFRGQFLAATDPESLNMSVLGRDILDFFAAIIDRPRDVVCLLSQRHEYEIIER
jgi:hypothetical protein